MWLAALCERLVLHLITSAPLRSWLFMSVSTLWICPCPSHPFCNLLENELNEAFDTCSFCICRANMIHFSEKSYPLTECCYLSFNKVLLFFLWQNIVIYLLTFLYSTWENVCWFSIRSWSSFFSFVLCLRLRVKPFSGCQIVKEENLHFLKFYFTTVWSPWAVRYEGRMMRSLTCRLSDCSGQWGRCTGTAWGWRLPALWGLPPGGQVWLALISCWRWGEAWGREEAAVGGTIPAAVPCVGNAARPLSSRAHCRPVSVKTGAKVGETGAAPRGLMDGQPSLPVSEVSQGSLGSLWGILCTHFLGEVSPLLMLKCKQSSLVPAI